MRFEQHVFTAAAIGLTAASPIADPKLLDTRINAAALPGVCQDNACSVGCRQTEGAGDGFPHCVVYPTEQLGEYPRNDQGQISVFFDFPAPDPSCRFIVRSPANVDMPGCGLPIFTTSGAACHKVDLQSTFMLQFCCGTGDCESATGSSKRMAGGSSALLLKDKDGNVLPVLVGNPGDNDSVAVLNSSSVLEARDAYTNAVAEKRALTKRVSKPATKRQDECKFVMTREPYTKLAETTTRLKLQGGDSDIQCPQGGTCEVTVEDSITTERSMSIEVSIGDPFGVVSATTGFEWSESKTHSVSRTFIFPESSQGYIGSTAVLQCVEGHFSNCDDNNDQAFTACQQNDSPAAVDAAVVTRT